MTAPTCDLCPEPVHDCHGGEIYLCEKHWDDLVIVCGYGIEPDDWWDAIVEARA